MPIRQEITILGPDEVRHLNDDAYFDNDAVIITPDDLVIQKRKRLGWTVSEKIGIGVINPKALIKLRKMTDDSN